MDLSIVVGSCDKYSFLWDKFTKRFNQYWDVDVELKKQADAKAKIKVLEEKLLSFA